MPERGEARRVFPHTERRGTLRVTATAAGSAGMGGTAVDGNETITFDRRGGQATAARGGGDLTDALVETDIWTDGMVADAGIPIVDVPFVTVGGGIGSFVMVDYLRIAGVPADRIKVLTQHDRPYEQYAFLCANSQIPGPERLRSDSGSCPDNIWGFPAYAIREAVAERTLKPLWNVFTEPVIKDYYTPRAGHVFRALDREAARIGWTGLLERGQVRMVRRRAGGGYFTILTPPQGSTRTKRVAYRSRRGPTGRWSASGLRSRPGRDAPRAAARAGPSVPPTRRARRARPPRSPGTARGSFASPAARTTTTAARPSRASGSPVTWTCSTRRSRSRARSWPSRSPRPRPAGRPSTGPPLAVMTPTPATTTKTRP